MSKFPFFLYKIDSSIHFCKAKNTQDERLRFMNKLLVIIALFGTSLMFADIKSAKPTTQKTTSKNSQKSKSQSTPVVQGTEEPISSSEIIPSKKENSVAPSSSMDDDIKDLEAQGFYLVDSIKAVVYSEDGTEVVTKSDIDRPGLDGSFRTLDDVVLERLMYLDAKRFKILPDEDTIDKHLKAVQRETT